MNPRKQWVVNNISRNGEALRVLVKALGKGRDCIVFKKYLRMEYQLATRS